MRAEDEVRFAARGAIESDDGRDGLRAAFLESMARSSAAVHVVTTSDGIRAFGVTVSACSSVCADPPTLLVCINTRSPACSAVAFNLVFAVNLLSTRQRHIADTFAGRLTKEARLEGTSVGKPFDFSCCTTVPGALGSPLIDGAVASLECRVVAQQSIGTHIVFFGEVQDLVTAGYMPLLYCRRDYGQFQAFEQTFSTDRGTVNDQNR